MGCEADSFEFGVPRPSDAEPSSPGGSGAHPRAQLTGAVPAARPCRCRAGWVSSLPLGLRPSRFISCRAAWLVGGYLRRAVPGKHEDWKEPEGKAGRL